MLHLKYDIITVPQRPTDTVPRRPTDTVLHGPKDIKGCATGLAACPASTEFVEQILDRYRIALQNNALFRASWFRRKQNSSRGLGNVLNSFLRSFE